MNKAGQRGYKGYPSYHAPVDERPSVTHEAYIHLVRDAIVAGGDLTVGERQRIARAKLTYGAGDGSYRGVCHFAKWTTDAAGDLLEIAALSEEGPVQLAGTTTHELAHVVAGHGAGHDAQWKAACQRLGLFNALAAGMQYTEADLAPHLASIATGYQFSDGTPNGHGSSLFPFVTRGARPCPLGIGTRGGTSRGPGSGSRLRLYQCACTPDKATGRTNKARVASDNWTATCKRCGADFTQQAEAPIPAPAGTEGE